MNTNNLIFYFTDNSNGEISVKIKHNNFCKEIAVTKLSTGNYQFELSMLPEDVWNTLSKTASWCTPSLPHYNIGCECSAVTLEEENVDKFYLSVGISSTSNNQPIDAIDAMYIFLEYVKLPEFINGTSDLLLNY